MCDLTRGGGNLPLIQAHRQQSISVSALPRFSLPSRLPATGRYEELLKQRIFGSAPRRRGGEPKIACTKPLPWCRRLWALNQGQACRAEGWRRS